MKVRSLLPSICLAILLIQGCTKEYAEPETPQVLEDRAEAKLIMRYLNNGVLNFMLMKQIFYDLQLIRALYGDEISFLYWCTFIPKEELRQQKALYINIRIDGCMMYPRKIRDGISYLFMRQWNEKAGGYLYKYYQYFECKFDDVKYYGIYDPQIPVEPDWWSEAEKNLELYDSTS
jgi:hypothetical protein